MTGGGGLVLSGSSLLVVLSARGESIRIWQFLGLNESALPGETRVMEVAAIARPCNTANWGVRFVEAADVPRFRFQDPSG